MSNDFNTGIHLCIEASIVRAKARIAGMEAENARQAIREEYPKYDSDDFERVLVEEGVTHNQVHEQLQRRY